MTFALTWMPEVLEAAGLKVALVPGWDSRGHGDMGAVAGVMCHTTVGARSGNMPSLRVLVDGRTGLSGPLAQLGLGRDGTYYVIAAGRCHHAGDGRWQGITAGNSRFIGIEGENTGRRDDRWPDVQLDAYRRGVAALLKHLGQGAAFCVGHREYALPAGRKVDPDFDMDEFRADVGRLLDGSQPPHALIPAVEPSGAGRPTLRRGIAQGEAVRQLQTLLRLTVDGIFGPRTESAVREFQRLHGLVPDGIVGPKTWRLFDAVATP